MLRIILGRSGSGKSEKCITEFNAYIQKNRSIDTFSYLFVPEQYNMITERRLLEYQIEEDFPVKGLFGHEVLNFKRFVHRILCTYGMSKAKTLTECGKIMLLTSAVSKCADKLVYYKSLKEKNGEISRLLSLIDEFAKYNVSVEDISRIETGDSFFNKKLHDISLIYSEYENLKKGKYEDENDSYENMLTHVEQNLFFENKSVWIDSFTGFTAQELRLIKLMLRQCKSVTVALCTDLSGEPAFACVDATLKALENLADENGIETQIINLSSNRQSNREKYKDNSILMLEQNISRSRITESYIPENIFLTECENIFDEVNYCAEQIKILHDEHNFDYRNIAVALRDIKGYDVIIKSIFKKYDIPFFVDDKKSVDNNPLVKTVLSLLNVIINDWQPEDVLEYLKSGLTVDSKSADAIENVILSTGLKGAKRYRNSEYSECLEIYSKVSALRDGLSKCKNLKDTCNVLCKYLENYGVRDNLEKLVEEIDEDNTFELKNEYSRIWNIMMEVIQQIVLFLGDEKCSGCIKSADMLRKLLLAGFAQYRIGFLPARLDSVQIINIERSRSSNIKALFLIGANEGIIPANFSDDGMLKDAERELLNKYNIVLADDSEMKVSKENYYIYSILSLPTEFLSVSWPLEDIGCASVSPSHVILRKIKKLFPTIKITQYKKEALKENERASDISDADISLDTLINKELYNFEDVFTTSVSQIEKYYMCPYSYFMTYGLKLKPRNEAQLKQLDFGSVVHEIAQEISDKLFEIPTDTSVEKYEELVETAYEKIKSKLRFSKYELTEHDLNILNRVKHFAAKSFRNIRKQVDAGEFKVCGYETPFGENKKSPLKPLTIIPQDASAELKAINVEGRIDRYDIMEDETGHKYIRVVDYKTSAASASITDYAIKRGIALQLITYLNVVVNSFEKNTASPAGALYYVFDSDIKSISEHITVSTDSAKVKQYNMKGFVLDNDDVIDKMTGGNTFVIGGYGNKDGKLVLRSKDLLKTEEDFETMKETVYSNIEKASVSISKGEYPIAPYIDIKAEKNACKYCEMRSVCGKCTNILD
ncbi:MAG: hypothetical protein E7387_05945 [Ruminococcaceae bacterium]|nr:hypothetical protein [Oscillospiraceae bacterium]